MEIKILLKAKNVLYLKIDIETQRQKGRAHTSYMHILIDSPTTVGSITVFCCQSFKAWKKKKKSWLQLGICRS